MNTDLVSADRYIPAAFEGKLEPNYYCRAWNAARQKYCRQRAGAGTEHAGIGRCRHHQGRPPRTGRYSSIRREEIRELIEQYELDPDPLNMLPDLAAARAIFQDYIERYDEWREALFAWHASWSEQQRPVSPALAQSFRNILDDYEDRLVGAVSEREALDLDRARKFVDYMADPNAAPKPRQMLDLSAAIGHLDAITRIVSRIEKVAAENAISRKALIRLMTAMSDAVEQANGIADPVERLRAIRRDWMSIRLLS